MAAILGGSLGFALLIIFAGLIILGLTLGGGVIRGESRSVDALSRFGWSSPLSGRENTENKGTIKAGYPSKRSDKSLDVHRKCGCKVYRELLAAAEQN